MNINEWDKTIKMGNQGEELFITTFKGVFEPSLKRIDYGLFPQSQKQGIDIILSKQSVDFDVKSRDYSYHRYNDFLIETISVVEDNKPGWIYYTKSQYIVYVWFNKFKTKFIDGYLIHLPQFKVFFDKNIHLFRQPPDAVSERNGKVWHTRNKIVPISKIPDICIKKVDMELLGVKEQLLLSDFFEFNCIKKQTSFEEFTR